jgi:hypothetical protein
MVVMVETGVAQSPAVLEAELNTKRTYVAFWDIIACGRGSLAVMFVLHVCPMSLPAAPARDCEIQGLKSPLQGRSERRALMN